MIRRQLTNGRIRIVVGLALLLGFFSQVQHALSERGVEASPTPAAAPAKPDPAQALASPVRSTLAHLPTIEDQASHDPYVFLQESLQDYDRRVRDYTCTFTKTEYLAGELSDEQVMRAMFREKPFSVRLEWLKNADKANRVLYVADKWMEDGNQMAVVEPGAIARFFVSYVMRPIHGADAQKASRRTIDQFGMRNSLALTLKFATLAKAQNKLRLEYVGKGKVDNRDTLVFERRLPYTGEDCGWPDRTLVVNLDREYRLPTLCESYADDEKKNLLGRYMISNVKLNANLPDSVFTKEGMGLE